MWQLRDIERVGQPYGSSCTLKGSKGFRGENQKMNEMEKTLDIQSYLDIGRRRKWHIIIPLVVSVLVSFTVYKFLPKVYKASTLILVQAQRVPETYVRPTITAPITDRLNTISQEILSRTRLEKVIQEFNLYSESRDKVPLEEIVENMRKAIEINVQARSSNERAQNTFSISYEGEEPKTVMMVTNKLASLFIEENLKVRELQAESTSDFLSKELGSVEEKLIKKEQDLRNFRERHMGELPQQLEANLRTLERLQQQLKTTSEGIRAAEDRSILVQNQIDQLIRVEAVRPPMGSPREPTSGIEDSRSDGVPEDPIITQWNLLKRELIVAQTKYTESHPDVIELRRKIATLDPKVTELVKRQEAAKEAQRKEVHARREGVSRENLPVVTADPALERLIMQYREQYAMALMEANRLKAEEKKTREQLVLYQKRIEDTPKREQEMLLVTRDYDLLKANYQSLLDKKIQSQMAENLERKQQGEQFKVLDPARLPEKPFRPDANKILLIGALIGLVSGLGLAWFRESLDQTFYNVADLEDYLKLSVIAEIPNMQGERAFSQRG